MNPAAGFNFFGIGVVLAHCGWEPLEMTSCELPTGAGLHVLFDRCRLLFRAKRDRGFDLPWTEFDRGAALAGVMLAEALAHVGSQAAVVLGRIRFAE